MGQIGGALENHSDHQHPGTGFSGSPAKDQTHGRFHQCRIGRADHVRSDAEAKRQLGGTSPSGNSTKWLT